MAQHRHDISVPPPASQEFIDILRKHLPALSAGQPIVADQPLTELGLDSMSSIALLFDLEDNLGIVFPEEWLANERQTFATMGSLWNAVTVIRNEGAC